MKINISIEDATPEEFARLFGGLQTERPVHVAVATTDHRSQGPVTNFSKGPWSDTEKSAIMSVPEDEAWTNYHRQFPNSSRTKYAVRRMRTHLLDKGVVVKPPEPSCIEIKEIKGSTLTIVAPPSPKKEAKPMVEKPAKFNQFGIPSSLLKQDKKLYQRLWARCKSQGIKYDEALAQEGVMKRGKRKAPVKKERLLFHQNQAGGSASSDTNSQVITSGIPTTPTEYRPLSPGQFGLHLKTGDKVRHNGSKASPFFGKVGEIQKLSADGQCYIKFGESLTWLSPYSVVVVPEAGA